MKPKTLIRLACDMAPGKLAMESRCLLRLNLPVLWGLGFRAIRFRVLVKNRRSSV